MEQRGKIRALAEELDQLRKDRIARHKQLTMTGLYNVLERLRALEHGDGAPFSPAEQDIYDHGLVGTLRELHDDLDAAVADAYGWPLNLAEETLLFHLVELNRERRREERQGLVRWLRPEYQNADGVAATVEGDQISAVLEDAAVAGKTAFPRELPARIRAVRQALDSAGGPTTSSQIARHFSWARQDTVRELLDTLVALGQAQTSGSNYFLTR